MNKIKNELGGKLLVDKGVLHLRVRRVLGGSRLCSAQVVSHFSDRIFGRWGVREYARGLQFERSEEMEGY